MHYLADRCLRGGSDRRLRDSDVRIRGRQGARHTTLHRVPYWGESSQAMIGNSVTATLVREEEGVAAGGSVSRAVRTSSDGSEGVPRRVQVMYRLHCEGRTLEEVGHAFGITRQRVSQLFKDAGLPVVGRAARPRVKPDGETQRRIARAALEDAASTVEGPLSAETFDALRVRSGASWPSAHAIAGMIGEGSWPRAVEGLGIESVRENQLARVARRRALIVDLWAGELTCKQIADVLETTPGYVSVEVSKMRNLGYDLPHRRTRRAS